MDRFTWDVDAGADNEFDFQVSKMRFGNGYKQSVGSGINNEEQKWNISMFVDRRDPNSRGNQALKFLRERKGYIPFLWTNPYGETIIVKCDVLKDAHNGAAAFTMSAVFEQYFMP